VRKIKLAEEVISGCLKCFSKYIDGNSGGDVQTEMEVGGERHETVKASLQSSVHCREIAQRRERERD